MAIKVDSIWKPDFIEGEYPDDFFEWIESITLDFQNRKDYEPFILYEKQANDWLEDKTKITDFYDKENKEKFRYKEVLRIRENSLFFLDKYHTIVDGDMAGMGTIDYKAKDAQKILCYLFDCHYNLLIGKARQIWFTSTMGGLFIKRVSFFSGYYALYVADEVKKAQRIFKEKMRYSFFTLPDYLRPTPSNVRDDMLAFAGDPKKGKTGIDSRLEVVSPGTTSATGEAPSLIGMDEIGLNKDFAWMMSEMLPALYKYNIKTDKLERTRQLVAWGCVCAGTKVWNNDGRLINIEDLNQEDGILGYDGRGVSKELVTWVKPPVKKPCYRITATGGDFIECSNDHPLMWSIKNWRTSGGKKKVTFKRAEDIKVGDQLMMIGEVPVFGNKRIKDARLLGLLIGDGNYSFNSVVQLSVADKEIKEFIEKNYNTKVYKTKILKDGSIFEAVGIRGFVDVLRKHGMHGQSSLRKRLPADIDSFNKKSLVELIGGYFDADGNVCYNKKSNVTRIVLTSICRELLEQIKYQLIKLGVSSTIYKENRGSENKLSSGQKDHIYRLYIANQKDVLKFRDEIAFLCKHKQNVLDRATKVRKIFRSIRRGFFEIGSNGEGEYFVNKLLNRLRYKVVTNVKYIGEKEVYNLTAGNTNTYIANGFVTKNTGGQMSTGGAEMETEWKAARKSWKSKKYNYPLIPVMFNTWARPGCDKKFYDMQRQIAYSKEGPDAEDFRIKFHQHYPISEQDMFLQTVKTLIPYDEIITHINRIYQLPDMQKPEYGYFTPVYNTAEVTPSSDLPHPVVGAIWNQTRGIEDPLTTTVIFQHPEEGWRDRYYKGTDPISSETGHSLMASAIWDSCVNTFSAVMNWRTREYRKVFLQSFLLGLYYGHNIKDLIEINNGELYVSYVEGKEYSHQLVSNLELPKHMQITSGPTVGINNKGHVPMHIIHAVQQMLSAYGDNIWIVEFFEQLKTFIEKTLPSGRTRYQAKDLKYWRDDIIFGGVYSYICAQCYSHYKPSKIDEDEAFAPIIKYDYDENYTLRLAEFDKEGKRIRFIDNPMSSQIG